MDAQHSDIKAHSHYEQLAYQSSMQVQQRAIEMMRQCDGWCSEEKGAFLVSLILDAKPDKIVEIGVYGGKSLVPMACALKANQKGMIVGIDPWDSIESVKELRDEANVKFWERLDHGKIKRTLMMNIYKFNLQQQVTLIEKTSEAVSPITDIGLLHIDGNHSDAASYFDVCKWAPLVKSGGYIILDDMTWCEKGVFTTARAAEWLDANCMKLTEFTDNCKWGVWVKP
jgi:predicted O-methyltransferase YrrM